MEIDNKEPVYFSVSKDVWERAKAGEELQAPIEFTPSMRLAEKDASELAKFHPSNTALMCKMDTARLFKDHGQPTDWRFDPDRHDRHEFSFCLLEDQLKNFVDYVVNVIEIGIDWVEDQFDCNY